MHKEKLKLKLKMTVLRHNFGSRIRQILRRNSEIEFYIIRRNWLEGGFFSNWFYVVGHMVYAQELGLIPVVDMMNYRSVYAKDGAEGNSWELYFKSPHTLNDALKGKSYIYSSMKYLNKYSPCYHTDDGFHKKNIRYAQAKQVINKWIQPVVEIKSISNQIDGPILGIHYRGTDKIKYNKIYRNHRLTSHTDNYLSKAKKMIEDHGISSIFLCTDQVGISELFKEKLNIPIFENTVHRSSSDKGVHTEGKSERPDHGYLLGCEVILDTYMLSKCDYLIYGNSNITAAALMLDHNYKDVVYV